MSTYTTGEIAKLCGVTVRTVQYYDARGILVPSGLTEGGRRLYSEEDLKRMKVICFLRDLGLPIESIGKLLSEEDPGSVVSLLLDRQEAELRREIGDREEQLRKLLDLKAGLKGIRTFSVDSVGDIARFMNGRKELRRFRVTMLLTGLPVTALQWVSVILWITKGIRWPFLVWVAVAVPWGILVSLLYYRKVSYVCPQCHDVFRPAFWKMFFANHTPAARKLTCPACGHHGFCVEVAAGTEGEADA